MKNIPDIVYTWAGINNTMSTRNRYNNELYYSIKSILKYLSWCKNIYILVNRDIEIPSKILNLNIKKIKRINRSNLFEDQKYSLTQNSFAVYSIVDKIPNLNERFILFDDDFMFLRPLSIDYFFKDNLPIIRLKHNKMKIYNSSNIVIPSNLKRPKYKYTNYSHFQMPCTKEIIKKFRKTYPNYNSFVESHITRFHGLSEDMFMIYYQFGLENNMILQKYTKDDFYQISTTHSNNIILFTFEFIKYIFIFLTQSYKYFNLNDDWSTNKKKYNEQMKIIKIFLYILYGS